MFKISAFALGFGLIAGMAGAQTAPTPDMAVAAAKNQLGVLEYCVAQGYIGADAIEVQARMLDMMPPVEDKAALDEAYAKGQAGTVSAMGVEQALADAAAAQGTDEKALCDQLSTMVVQAGEQLPK
ncbi:MAG: pore-forming ESAT-6 family protein [Paracoccus sp. (in: a-proteobacteria)]